MNLGQGRQLGESIRATILREVAGAGTLTCYREPLVAFGAADDPHFGRLSADYCPGHLAPEDLLPGARSIISFFIPFAQSVVASNEQHGTEVSPEWALAYVETNTLIGRIAGQLGELLSGQGIRSAAEPPTHNFDPVSLRSRWSHKSIAVIAGLGSFGLHQMVITEAGCAGRFGSMVIDAPLPTGPVEQRVRCLFLADGSCLECVQRCPVGALVATEPFDRTTCYDRLLAVADRFAELGLADVCGKCAIGPCALEDPVGAAG